MNKNPIICRFTMNNKNMIQKLFKKSAAFKMGIPRKGCIMSKSLSPVIIHEAFTETANSRYLSSLGSRHSRIVYDTFLKTANSLNCFKANNLSSKEIYLSNFDRNKTSLNSSYV